MKNKILSAQIIVFTTTILVIAIFNLYSLVLNETNHTSRFLPNPEGEQRDFENLNFVEHFLTQTDKIEISFIENLEQFSSRKKITPHYTITDQAEIKKILSFISEKTEYITAIGKLPNEKILKSGRMYFYQNNEHILTSHFYKDNMHIIVADNKIEKMNINHKDIVSEPRIIYLQGVKYLEKKIYDI